MKKHGGLRWLKLTTNQVAGEFSPQGQNTSSAKLFRGGIPCAGQSGGKVLVGRYGDDMGLEAVYIT